MSTYIKKRLIKKFEVHVLIKKKIKVHLLKSEVPQCVLLSLWKTNCSSNWIAKRMLNAQKNKNLMQSDNPKLAKLQKQNRLFTSFTWSSQDQWFPTKLQQNTKPFWLTLKMLIDHEKKIYLRMCPSLGKT